MWLTCLSPAVRAKRLICRNYFGLSFVREKQPAADLVRGHLRHVIVCSAVVAVASVGLQGQLPSAKSAVTDLDAFMEQALQRRDIDRKTLQDYVLDEVEAFELDGPGGAPLMRQRREYTWFVQDGIHVRSPLRYDGVPIPEVQRRTYEKKWIHSEEQRRKFRAERDAKRVSAGEGPAVSAPSPNEPRFVSESYFMDFKFEPGNYYLAGKEQLDGHDVLKIDYVPTKLFADDEPATDEGQQSGDAAKGAGAPATEQPKKPSKKPSKAEQQDIDINRQMNKTSQVTLWVDPATHQIVKYTFVNVWLDFLPAQYIVKIDDLKASMEMEQPFPGVWLPRDIDIRAGVTTALGSLDASYHRDFSKYRRADVSSKLIIPKKGGGQ